MDTPEIPPPPPPVTPPVPPSPSKNYSGILIGILLLVIAILVSMELNETPFISNIRQFLGAKPTPAPTSLPTPSPTPDPTADWKTYTNTEYNYIIKYPSNLTVGESGMGGGNIQKTAALVLYQDNPNNFNSPRFAIGIRNDNLSLKEIATQHYDKLSRYQMTQVDREATAKNLGFPIIDPVIQEPLIQTTFLDLPAYTYTLKSNEVDDSISESLVPTETHKYIWLERNKQFLLISFTDTVPMNQILTTFKFLDPTTDTSNWKTYKDSQLNIEFKYPNNLTYKDLGNGVIKFIDNQNITKFNFSGFQSFTPVEFQNYLKQRASDGNPIDQKTFTDSQNRTWQTDMGLGEVFNFTGVLNQQNKYYVIGLQSGIGEEADNGNSFRNFSDQILSTFSFTQ